MHVLTVTNMYPTERNPPFGNFVKQQVESIRASGIDVDVLFINGRDGCLRRKAYALGLPRLWQALARKRYDLIHAHYVLSGIIARGQLSAPLVLTHHGVEVIDPVQGALCRWTKSWPDEMIVVAEWMAAQLKVPEAYVIPCGIDLQLFQPMDSAAARQRLGLDHDHRYVLFAGESWQPVKRYHLVRAAVDILRHRHPDVQLLTVAGQPHHIIPSFMNAADAFAMTSVTEGSAQVIKEAMACNLPIVATDAGDNWDVMGDIQGCYRTGPDPAHIAAALESAISPPRRTDGRARVQRFGLPATARAVISVYESAIQRARQHSSTSVRRTGRVHVSMPPAPETTPLGQSLAEANAECSTSSNPVPRVTEVP